MTLRGIRGALLGALAVGTALLAAPPRLYRWRDAQGREHVTNTPPPEGATPLDVPPMENTREAAAPASPKVAPAPGKALHTHRASAAEEQRWQALEQRMVEARVRQDTPTLDALAADLVAEARWGHGLRALVLLPLALGALCTLLGWWLGHGLLRPHLSTGAGLLAGLLAAHAAWVAFLQRPQALRLQTTVAALVQHLGAPQHAHPERIQQLTAQASALEGQARLLRAPWAFAGDVDALEDTLRRVVRTP